VTVLLSGVGGDELFAGYRKHAAHYWAQAYQRVSSVARRLLEGTVASLPGLRGTGMKGRMRLAKKMARSASLSASGRFVMNCTYMDARQKSELYTTALWDEVSNFDPSARHHTSFEQVRDADFLNQMLYLDTKIFMPSLNLTYNDKMSMASSVEVRVPFLDRELAEFVAWNVPPRWKLKGFFRPATKYIFRKAMRGLLPQEVLKQPKAGFAAPVDYWLAHDLKEMVDDLLSESRLRRRGLLRPEAVRKFVDEHRSGAQDWSMQIWQFLTLELWMQTFLDGGAKNFVTELDAPQAATA
jgi:asparagine synthase (glutamine-hydrolysing)